MIRALAAPLAAPLAALALAGLLTACGPEAIVSTGLSVASMKLTKKTLSDHAIGLVTNQDCSSLRAANGDVYCLTSEEIEARVPDQPEYCYRTIGDVRCYNRPDETKTASRLLH